MSLKRELAERILARRSEIRAWYEAHAEKAPPPFYCSVDLRDAGYKIVPVDSNLYPAGFNNICPVDQRGAPEIFRERVQALLASRGVPGGKRLLILPESHTENRYYIENLYALSQILKEAGFEVTIGWYPGAAPAEGPIPLTSVSGKTLEAWPITVEGGQLRANGQAPDLILMNNDFSSGYPTILDSVAQPVVPSHRLGWHTRKKSDHFRHYNALAEEFAALVGLDPWPIQVATREVAPVNLNEGQGQDELAEVAGRMLGELGEQFAKRRVPGKPFVFVKNNSGGIL